MIGDTKKTYSTYRILLWTALGLLAYDALSVTSYAFPSSSQLVVVLVAVSFFAVSYYRPAVGMLIMFAELFNGVQGYGLSFVYENTAIPLRMIVFVIWLTVAGVTIVLHHRDELRRQWNVYWREVVGVGFVILLGVVIGLLQKNELDLIFFDSNGWLFWAYLLPCMVVTISWRMLWPCLAAAGFWLAAKTVVLEYIFSHAFLDTQWALYLWLRDYRLFEITPIAGSFQRVFSQSHILLLLIVLLGVAYSIQKQAGTARSKIIPYTVLLISMSAILISYSRSIWLGLVGGAVLTVLVYLWLRIRKKITVPAFGRMIVMLVLSVVAGLVVFFVTVNIPIPPGDGVAFSDLVTSRFASDEPAVNARILLLEPLIITAAQTWFVGAGFGTTVTYITTDPRIVSQTPGGSGIYTTYAFEWGYLDIWLKVGLIGLLIYGMILYRLWKRIFETAIQTNSLVMMAISMTLLSVYITHFTTPYVNHPLGIGLIVICLVLAKSYGERTTTSFSPR